MDYGMCCTYALTITAVIIVLGDIFGCSQSDLIKYSPSVRYEWFSKRFPKSDDMSGFHDVIGDAVWIGFKSGLSFTVLGTSYVPLYLIISDDFDLKVKALRKDSSLTNFSHIFDTKTFLYDDLPEAAKRTLDVYNRFGFSIEELPNDIRALRKLPEKTQSL